MQLLIQKPFKTSDEGFKISSCIVPQMRYLHAIQIWRVTRWPCYFSNIFAGSSYGGIVERHVQYEQSPMHLIESAAPSSSSRLHCSMNFGRRN